MLVHAQIKSDLETAYLKNSSSLVEKIILENKSKETKLIDKNLDMDLKKIITNLVSKYADGFKINFQNTIYKAGEGTFIILQPEVQICFVNELDSARLFALQNPNRPRTAEWNLYPHKNVYGSFISGAYLKFPNLTNCKTVNYKTISRTGRHKVVVADTNLIHKVNDFLKVRGVDHLKKTAFLKKSIKLIPNGRTEDLPEYGRSQIKYFNYDFYIDKIIFDKTLKSAFVQMSFPSSSWEILYKKNKGLWIEKHALKVIE